MNKTDSDVLKQVLEIVDMFADENMRMAYDTILKNSALRVRGDEVTIDRMSGEGIAHTAMFRAAQLIGDAIRERFGLPPKQDEDPA